MPDRVALITGVIGQDGALLAELVAKVAGWSGEFTHDPSKPDGMPRKVMDVSRLARSGWTAHTPLEDGLRRAHFWWHVDSGDP